MNKKNQLEGYQARSIKKFANHTRGDGLQEQFQESEFISNSKVANKYSRKSRITNKEDQIDFYGYEIEPFQIKEDRALGNYDQVGFFHFNKQKESDKDAWLDEIDEAEQKKIRTKVSTKKIRKMESIPDGYEKERRNQFGNINVGDGYFKSRRFETKEEADEYYRNLDNQQQHLNEDQSQSSDELEEEEIPCNKHEQKSRPKPKDDLGLPDLQTLDCDELKKILVDLIEPNESPNQAISRLKRIITPNKPQPFKKNQRKQVKLNETEQPVPTKEEIEEARHLTKIIIEICHAIMTKADDPDIYTRQRQDIINNDPDFLTTKCPNTEHQSQSSHQEEASEKSDSQEEIKSGSNEDDNIF